MPQYTEILISMADAMDAPALIRRIDFAFVEYDIFLTLETRHFEGEPHEFKDKMLFMYGMAIPCYDWWNEWPSTWQHFKVSVAHGLALINLLRENKCWTWSDALTSIADAWDDRSKQKITSLDIGLNVLIEPAVINPAQLTIPLDKK